MIIGVMTDSHSNLPNLGAAAAVLRQRAIRTVLHCGDICSPAAVETLRDLDVHWVFGNCDVDQLLLRHTMVRFGHTCHGLVGSLDTGEHRIGFTHGHHQQLLAALIDDDHYRYVCHGHSHTIRDEVIGSVRVLNSGALANAHQLSLMVLDTATDRAVWEML